jgi:hypothetical protein
MGKSAPCLFECPTNVAILIGALALNLSCNQAPSRRLLAANSPCYPLNTSKTHAKSPARTPMHQSITAKCLFYTHRCPTHNPQPGVQEIAWGKSAPGLFECPINVAILVGAFALNLSCNQAPSRRLLAANSPCYSLNTSRLYTKSPARTRMHQSITPKYLFYAT